MLQTPLKSPNRFVSANFLKQHLDPSIPIHSFLPFSCELELSLFREGMDVSLHTNSYPVFEFWSCFKTDPSLIGRQAEAFHPKVTPGMVPILQAEWYAMRDPYFRSCIFFLLNRYSETGTISHGKLDIKNYTPISLNPLRNCDERILKLKLKYHKNEHWLSGIEKIDETDCVMLPVGRYAGGFMRVLPQSGPETYDVNHREVKEFADTYAGRYMIIYKFHPGLLREYKNHNIICLNKFGEPTESMDLAHEVLITNIGNQ